MKLLKFVIIISATLLCSCESFLNENPESILSPATFYNSVGNVEIAVNGVYDILGNRGVGGNSFGNYNHGLQIMGVLGTDQFRSYNEVQSHRFSQMDLYTYTSSSQLSSEAWTVHYIGINRANTVIANTEPMLGTGFNDDDLNRLLAEARFLRAWYYFNLVRFYGEVPLKLTETASLTASDVVGISRAPISAIYSQIEEDLLFAEQYLLLPSELPASDNGRATKTAAWAFLARFYSTWAMYPLKDASKWSDAAAYAKKVIDSKEHVLLDDFTKIFGVENEGNKELILVVKNTGIEGENGTLGAANGVVAYPGASGDQEGTSASYAQVRIENNFYKSYDNKDLRKEFTVSSYRAKADGTKVPLTEAQINTSNLLGFAKFKRNGSWTGFMSPTDFPLLRYAEVLLLYAEATANKAGGPTAESFEAINQVRRRAFGLPVDTPDPSVDLTGLSLTDFNNAVLTERSWELTGEDCSRWHDLIRYELLGKVVTATKRPLVLVSFDENKHKLFPIPLSEIDSNPKINLADQNPGY